MKCCVPGCGTSYWSNCAPISLFTAITEERRENWENVLRREAGLTKFGEGDRICILHFREEDIERERTVFVSNGKHYKERRKRPLLSENALPTIFAMNTQKPKLPTNMDHSYSIDPDICTRKITNRLADDGNKGQKRAKLFKSDVENDNLTYEYDAELAEENLKANDLFGYIVFAIEQKKEVSEYLNNRWIPSIHECECVSWCLWKPKCSGLEKRIVLHNDLEIDVYLEEKRVSIPETNNVTDMCGFEKLLSKVNILKPCKSAPGDSR